MLNALAALVDRGDRILVIEDTPELQLPQPHVVYMKTRIRDIQGLPDVTLRDLIINTLRMRPDRIIVGEVRGPEAPDMLQAMNVGQEGVMATPSRQLLPRGAATLGDAHLDGGIGHAAKGRARQRGPSRGRDRLHGAPGGRLKARRAGFEVTGLEAENILMSDLFQTDSRKSAQGMAFELRPTGNIPRFFDQPRQQGLSSRRWSFSINKDVRARDRRQSRPDDGPAYAGSRRPVPGKPSGSLRRS